MRRNHSATDEINFEYIEDEDETETVSNDGNLTDIGDFRGGIEDNEADDDDADVFVLITPMAILNN